MEPAKKTQYDKRYAIGVNWELIGTKGGLSTGPIPDPLRPPTSKLGGQKFPFQISANRLQVDENVNRAHFRINWLVVK